MRAVIILVVLCCCSSFGYSQKAKKAKKGSYPQVMETHFDLLGGLICISPDEEQLGKYILDTGAPTLILNKKPEYPTHLGFQLVGVNGSFDISSKKVKDFELKGLELGNIRSFVTDLSHLESVKKVDFQGILGYEVFRHFEMFIDYQRQYLSFFQAGTNDLHTFIKPQKAITIYKKGHFPVVKIRIGKRQYLFGIDTGAEVNVIDQRLFKKLNKKHLTACGQINLQGLNENQRSANKHQVDKIQLGDLEYENMEFVFTDLSVLSDEQGFTLDGILGFPFLSSGKFSINYKKRKLYLWDDPLYEANALERFSLLSN